MTDLIITAPTKGWAAPLEEVPDPVFGERMLGDGVAIHPVGSTIHAPCDGTILTLHAAGHAVTIRSDAGAEILIHTGLETVSLGGRGFRPLTSTGTRVSRGDPLIEFDLDAVAVEAASLVTPVVVTNGDAFHISRRTTGKMVGVGEALMTLAPIVPERHGGEADGGTTLRRTIKVPLAHGIHARPSARIGACARAFDAEVEIVNGGRRANVRSAVALMSLAVQRDDQVTLEARGPDAALAIAAVGDLIASGMGEMAVPALAQSPASLPAADTPDGALAGVCASSGVAIGRAVWPRAETIEVEQDAADPSAARDALAAARKHVQGLLAEAAAQGSEAQQNILQAHLAFIEDEDLLATAHAEISRGRSAAYAWQQAVGRQVAGLRSSGDPRVAERADDLVDLERQVLLALAGRDPAATRFEPGTILLAEDLLPSQLIGLDTAQVEGVVLVNGGPTAHVAILAAARSLPMLVAVGSALADIPEGTPVVLDAEAGLLHVEPDQVTLERFGKRRAVIRDARAAALRSAQDACRMADGTRIELFANLGSLDDARLAVNRGAEGSGLLRTEFLFMDRESAPDEEEQLASYQAIADAMAGRPVIVRLLDIGGDKPASYVSIASEKNPMLGQRGVRVSLANPQLLDTQIRAILRVQPAGQCRIMVPMITGLAEVRAVRAAVDRARDSLGLQHAAQLGVMIETPAAAVMADRIAAETDFVSIGTNDLTQYTLAMDRENAAVASGVDALHPAVLRLIATACKGAALHGRPVGVCGGLASDPLGIPLLIGLGVTELSTTAAYVPEAKALVRRLTAERCRAFAATALDLATAAEVRGAARAFIEELN